MVPKLLLVLFLMSLTGCIGKVQWVEREGGTPLKKRCIPVCPSCNHVVSYSSAQCLNPQCRILLTWEDKILYADKLYGEDDQEDGQELELPPQQPAVVTPPAVKPTPKADQTAPKQEEQQEVKPDKDKPTSEGFESFLEPTDTPSSQKTSPPEQDKVKQDAAKDGKNKPEEQKPKVENEDEW